MFAKLSSLFTIFKNFDKIKEFAQTSYEAVDKTLAILLAIEDQITDTKLGTVLKKYLPEVISVLTKIKEAFEKYGHYIGVVPSYAAEPLSLVAKSDDELLADLKVVSNKLNVVLN